MKKAKEEFKTLVEKAKQDVIEAGLLTFLVSLLAYKYHSY